jgi:hypothetical protein
MSQFRPLMMTVPFSRRWRFAFLCILWTGMLAAVPAQALTPREELLRLVPADVGACMVIQDLRGNARAFLESSFVEQLQQSRLGSALRNAPETRKLLEVEKYCRTQLQMDWTRLRDEILGEAVVMAYWPGASGTPDQDQGVILVRAHDPAVLAEFFDHLLQALKQAKTASVEARQHNGLEYTHWSDGRKHGYFLVRGPILAFSPQEGVMRRVLDLAQSAPSGEEPPVAQHMRKLGVDKALAALWINPRGLEAEMEQKVAQASGVEAVVRRTVLGCWKALDGIALTASLQKADLELGLIIQADQEKLPATLRKMVASELRPSEAWQFFPSHAILTMAGRIDASGMTEFLSSFLTVPTRQAVRDLLDRNARAVLGRDVFQDVLPNLGPDWGLCIAVPPAADAQAWFPHVIGALRIQPGAKEPPLDRFLLDALNSAAMLGVVTYNNKHSDEMILKVAMQDKVEVKYLTNDKCFPSGFQPAFALKEGYLVLASSPAAMQQFRRAAGAAAPSAAEIPLVRLSLLEARAFIKGHLDQLAAMLAEKDGITREEAVERLDGIVTGLEFFDRLELCQRSTSGQVSLVLRMRTTQALRKVD